ncbi:hypothetical protein GALMADRAFT_1274943 [Galerina marginata CBS 339.88]|uniref:DNA2/NAM7 helicase-like C-terminal domain-containing protein n=1 Tax=Galerina marginata (strain CBS 339.88) TaxID=685588 RepID=A0A067TG40_GALM3|nr:hypothetical protein GALMADRAFT_1274943 [Galerina marginata CBS 339.88]
MQVTGQHGNFTVKGSVVGVSGRSGNVNAPKTLTDKIITTVTSIGRDDPTTAEAQRAATVLRILQGSEKLLDESPWIQNIWFPLSDDGLLLWPKEWMQASQGSQRRPAAPQQANLPSLPLNSSQQTAVNYMFSELDDHRITLVQGPPGTGKTSVIASFVQFSVALDRGGIWLVAQSNVAVKNIAEKLISSGFTAWKLLVSKDFQFQWHEHLYTKVSDNVIRSDQFNIASNKANLRGIQVILCTLSMLSNSQIAKFAKEVPLRTLVVDEASQIEIGDYISIFSNFKRTLRKACFIGDDKQLPPFGQEDLQDLQSIFEITHLKAVYDNKLNSNPLHLIKDDITACYFIDIAGKEKALETGSFLNELECQAILKLAQKLEEQEKKYRIITPYEGQRSHIEMRMQEEGLQWGDKCFNVDSFQGNEEDFIIISVVRTRALGFLKNLRRTNVMLSRCKKGMFIVSSLQFLTGTGAGSLVGQMLKKMDPAVWLTLDEIEEGKF